MAQPNDFERAELRFRQLCCLSMSGPLLAPALFRELYAMLPFASCLYMWLGPAGPTDVYFNVPEVGEYLPLYAQSYFRSSESEIWATPDEALGREDGPKLLDDVLRVPRAAYFRHAIYREILRPSNCHTFLRMLIRDRGVPIGTFTVSRGPHEREFDRDDQARLARLEPFIVHALAQRRQAELADTVDGSSALLIVDAQGRLLSQSSSAKTLLALSQGSLLAPAAVHEGLLGLVWSLSRVAQRERAARVPSWVARNAWGMFNARAYWLDQNPSSNSSIGIYLERRLPRRLAMLDALHELALPLRQEQVAWLLALGRTEDEAARELGVSRNTVIYHRRQIYNRLETDSRAGLVDRLGIGRPSNVSARLPGSDRRPIGA